MSKILAVGDLHTKLWMIDSVAELVNFYDYIVFCGDYADNWNTPPAQSIAAWRLLRQFMQEYPDKVYAVIGNHDYSYIHPEIAGRSSGWNQVISMLINAPENKKIKEWLLNLPITFKLDGVTFSHAGITEQWDGKEDVSGLWNDVSPIWARPPEFGGQAKYKEILQVIGHNPSKEIWNPQENIWCIDTFSEDQNNNFIGNQTLLEITNGKEFLPVKIKDIINA